MKVRTGSLLLGLTAVFIGAAVACSNESAPTPFGVVLTTPVANPTVTPEPIVTSFEGKVVQFDVNLALNGSPQQGTAVFTRRNDFVFVELRLRPGVPVQLVRLMRGKCPEPRGFERSLNQAVGGVMRQEIRDMPFDDLLAGDLTLVVGTDRTSVNSFAACGDLPLVE